MAEDIEFKTWEEVEKGRTAQRNIEAAQRILEAAGITADNPNYKRYFNATLLNVHNAGRFAVKDATTGEFMTYNEHVENMFIETLKNPEMSLEQYEKATIAFRDSFANDQLEIAQKSRNGNFSHEENFSYNQSVEAINNSITDGLEMRRKSSVKFPQEFYDENGTLRRLVVNVPEEFKSGADFVQDAVNTYGVRFEEIDGKKYFVDAKGNAVGPSKFFSSKSDLLQKRLFDKIGDNAELLDMTDTELLETIKTGDYQAFNALRAKRKGKGNPQLMNALGDEHVFHDVGKILNSADNMDKTAFVDEVKKLAKRYSDIAKTVQVDAGGTSWGKSIDRVVLSATPYDVATQSTFRNWQSCMHTTGCNWRYVDDAIGAGSIVAYGYNSKNPQQMISRYLIHPYYDKDGNVAYKVNDRVYGDSHGGFRKTIESVTEHFNEGKVGSFKLAEGLYNDNGGNIELRLLNKDALGRQILDDLSYEGKLRLDQNILNGLLDGKYVIVSKDMEIVAHDLSFPKDADLSHCENLKIEGNVAFGNNVKLPDSVQLKDAVISREFPKVKEMQLAGKNTFRDITVPADCDINEIFSHSDMERCSFEGKCHFAEGVKLPYTMNFKDAVVSGDLSNVHGGVYFTGRCYIETDKLPTSMVCFKNAEVLSGDFTGRSLHIEGKTSFADNVKLSDNISFANAEIADGTILDNMKNLDVSNSTIGKNVKITHKDKYSFAEFDNVVFSSGCDLTDCNKMICRGSCEFASDVAYPNHVVFSNAVLKGDLSQLNSVSFSDDIEILPNTQLPKEVDITSYSKCSVKGDLSSAEHVIFGRSSEIDLGQVTGYPKKVTFEGKIPNGIDLRQVEHLSLSGEISIGENVKLADNVEITLKNAQISKDFNFEQYKNIHFEGMSAANDTESLQKLLSSDAKCIYVEKQNITSDIKLPSDKAMIIIDSDGKALTYLPDEKAKKTFMAACEFENEQELYREANVVSKEEFTKRSGIEFTETKSLKTEQNIAETSGEKTINETTTKSAEGAVTEVTENATTKSVASEGAELAADATVKTAATKAATTATEKGAKSGVIETIKAVDDKVNTAIDKTIEKGSEKLNNTKVGKAYTKAEKAVANSTVGKAVNKGVKKVGSAVTKTIQKTGDAVAKTAAGKAVKKAAAKTAGKTAAKAVGKSVLKKIPLISVGAGLVFGAQRAMAGDWKGAAGEVASGALGTFPGLGTAASVAIDAGLAGRDIYNEMQTGEQTPSTAQTGQEKQAATKNTADIKSQMRTDAQKANEYLTRQQQQIGQTAKNKAHSSLKSAMKSDAQNAGNKYQAQMEDLIKAMNEANGKNKALDVMKTTAQLYQKYGDSAYALLQEAISKPSSCIGAINSNKLKTSRDVVQYLCDMQDNAQNRQIVQNILNNRRQNG